MIIFSHKYRMEQKTFFPWWMMWVGVMFQAVLNIGSIIMRSLSAIFVDAGMINLALWAGLSQKFTPDMGDSLYATETALPILGIHAAVTGIMIFMFLYNGIYSARHYTAKNLLFSGILSSALVLSGVHFLTNYGADGITDFVAALAAAILAVTMWREVLPPVFKGLKKLVIPHPRAVIVGQDHVEIAQYIKKIGGRRDGPQITGIILISQNAAVRADNGSSQDQPQGQIEGYPILGDINNMAQALSTGQADIMMIAASNPWYSEIINILVKRKNNGVNIRWEAME
jgi:hypothetical protein